MKEHQVSSSAASLIKEEHGESGKWCKQRNDIQFVYLVICGDGDYYWMGEGSTETGDSG